MSKTLNLVRVLLRQAQSCHDLGLDAEAKRRFERLSAFRSLPADVAEETQVRLSEICRDEDDTFKERQHLAGALAQQPNNPEYHFRMAQAYEADAHDDKARLHLRAALRLDPENSRYLAEFGALSARRGNTDDALRTLKKAHELADHDVDILTQYANALVDAGQADEALDVLKSAMFRHSRERRFRDLYRDFQFHAVAQQQSAARGSHATEPVILRFAPAPTKKRRVRVADHILRIDGAHPLPGPSRRSAVKKRTTQ
jgi:tetratricopeptide (TPR) repeat protein